MDERRFNEIVLRAIEGEIESRDFYLSAASRVEDAGVREIFRDLAREEEQHRNTLETFRFDPTARMRFEDAGVDLEVAEGTPEPRLSTEMAPKDAIQLAMKKEQRAGEMYEALARSCEDAEFRGVYENLARMERSHKQRLEQVFVDIAFPEVW